MQTDSSPRRSGSGNRPDRRYHKRTTTWITNSRGQLSIFKMSVDIRHANVRNGLEICTDAKLFMQFFFLLHLQWISPRGLVKVSPQNSVTAAQTGAGASEHNELISTVLGCCFHSAYHSASAQALLIPDPVSLLTDAYSRSQLLSLPLCHALSDQTCCGVPFRHGETSCAAACCDVCRAKSWWVLDYDHDTNTLIVTCWQSKGSLKVDWFIGSWPQQLDNNGMLRFSGPVVWGYQVMLVGNRMRNLYTT